MYIVYWRNWEKYRCSTLYLCDKIRKNSKKNRWFNTEINTCRSLRVFDGKLIFPSMIQRGSPMNSDDYHNSHLNSRILSKLTECLQMFSRKFMITLRTLGLVFIKIPDFQNSTNKIDLIRILRCFTRIPKMITEFFNISTGIMWFLTIFLGIGPKSNYL